MDVKETISKFDQYLVNLNLSFEAITFKSLGRSDLLLSKLFALCDRGRDIYQLLMN